MVNDKIVTQLYRLWEHLSRQRQLQFFLVLVLMLVSALTEIVSIGAIIPFLTVLTAPERFLDYVLVADVASYFGITTAEQLTLPVTILFVVAILLANVSRLLLLWVSTRFSFMTGADLSYEVYRRTLCQPYIIHLERNSSEIISGILNKVGGVVFGALLPVLTFISSFVLLCTVIFALIMIEPVITAITVFGFGTTYILITLITRKKLALNSRRIAIETTQVQKALQEGLGGIRDVLLDGTQKLYCDSYRKADLPLRIAQGNNIFIASSPKFGMETIGVSLIAIIAYMFSRQPGGITMVIPALGAIALGAQRLLPALQQCYASWSAIVGSQASLIDALHLLDQPIDKDNMKVEIGTKDFISDISLDNISFQYSDGMPWVLSDLSLEIRKGERIGFVGETGSGKSTTLDLIMGLLEPTSGRISIDGEILTDIEQLMWRKNIAHVPQSIFLIDSSIAENIAFGIPKESIDMERVNNAARQAQIADFIDTNPEGYNAMVGERGVRLSGGQRQRIGIARALYKDASVLIFDEATSALDDETEAAVMDAINNLDGGLTVLIIAHRLTTLRNCDRIIELKNGSVLHNESYEKMLEISPSFRSLRGHSSTLFTQQGK